MPPAHPATRRVSSRSAGRDARQRHDRAQPLGVDPGGQRGAGDGPRAGEDPEQRAQAYVGQVGAEVADRPGDDHRQLGHLADRDRRQGRDAQRSSSGTSRTGPPVPVRAEPKPTRAPTATSAPAPRSSRRAAPAVHADPAGVRPGRRGRRRQLVGTDADGEGGHQPDQERSRQDGVGAGAEERAGCDARRSQPAIDHGTAPRRA